MIKNKTLFLVFIFSFLYFLGFSQEVKNPISLKLIFERIARKHDINFNYIEDEIVFFLLNEPNENWTLKQKIEYIKIETKLQFNIINNKYYNIVNDKKLDKPLCGYLIDSETNIEITNANLIIENTTISAISNEKGYFELPTISANKIVISHVGYQSLTIESNELYVVDCPKIKLYPVIMELDEINAFRFLTTGIVKKSNGTIVIKPKNFGLLPGLIEPDIFQTIQEIPGIISVDKTISNINVRGGTHDQNLFLWNGMRLFQTGHFFGLISALNPNLANKITVSKNGSSAFYGESTSSVIDISTHSDKIENSTATFGANMINADFYAKLKTTKKSNLEFSARRSFTDFLNSPTYENYSNRIFQNTEVSNLSDSKNINYSTNKDFYFYDFTAQYYNKINNKSDFYIDLIAIGNVLNLEQSKSENFNLIRKNSFLEQKTYGGNAKFKTNFNRKNCFEVDVYATFYKLDSKNESINNNQILNQENSVLDTGIKLKNEWKINPNFTLKKGYQFNEIGIRNFDRITTPIFSRNIKNILRSHAIISEFSYLSKNRKFTSSSGIRVNYFQEFHKLLFEPRININYQLTNAFQVEFLAEAKSQTTSQIIDLQQDFLGVEKRRWILSNNKDVPIQKNNQVSIALIFKDKKWLISLDNFYKNVTGITSQSQGFENQLEFLKINGAYKISGSEFLIQKQFNQLISWISYSYTKNDYQFNDFIPNQFPNNFELKHNITFATIYNFNNLKIAFGGNWNSGKPTTNLVSNNPFFLIPDVPKIEYKSPNSSNLENYLQLNLSSNYIFNLSEKSKLQLGISVQNLLNNKNIINQNFRINSNINVAEKVDTFSLERTFNSNIRYNF